MFTGSPLLRSSNVFKSELNTTPFEVKKNHPFEYKILSTAPCVHRGTDASEDKANKPLSVPTRVSLYEGGI